MTPEERLAHTEQMEQIRNFHADSERKMREQAQLMLRVSKKLEALSAAVDELIQRDAH